MFDIIELQHELLEVQGKDPDRKIRARTAKVQQRQQDIEILSKGESGLNSAEIAQVLNIPLSIVEMEKARNNREEQMRFFTLNISILEDNLLD